MIIMQPESEEEFVRYYHFRWQILRQPWNQPKGSEKDQYENKAIHLTALDDDNHTILGVARLHVVDEATASIRYMAVTQDRRRCGIGSALIQRLEQEASKLRKKVIELNARESSLVFYQAHGYRVLEAAHTLYGEIKHQKMHKLLS